MKIFLAGTEPNKVIRSKTLYALDTFFYIDPNKPSDHRRFEDYLLDSGAFTFMSGGKDKRNINEYVEQYADYIVKNDIKNYFELDIDMLVGYDKVLQIRKYLEKKTDRPCIPVWHVWRGKQDFQDMCDRYEYVAVGGFAKTKNRSQSIYTQMRCFIDEAHRRHARIHGLGFTKPGLLSTHPFDTVDSTSWLSGARYGVYSIFTGDTIKLRQHKKGERCIHGAMESQTINGLEWLKFQKYAKEHL